MDVAAQGAWSLSKHVPEGRNREAYIPAQHPPPSPQARLSRPHAHSRGAGDHPRETTQGPDTALGLIWTIRGRRAFQTLARAGCKARTETLWCSFLNDSAATPLRVAFVVGRSIGSATRRNRLRRRLRASVAEVAPALGIGHGWLLIGARPAASEHTYAALRDEVTSLLTRVRTPVTR
jgi:ribonuclease P protein component